MSTAPRKTCPTCNAIFDSDEDYCTVDGQKLIHFTEDADLDTSLVPDNETASSADPVPELNEAKQVEERVDSLVEGEGEGIGEEKIYRSEDNVTTPQSEDLHAHTESKFDSIFSKLGLRKKPKVKNTKETIEEVQSNPLPDVLVNAGWRMASNPKPGSAYDEWHVGNGHQNGIFRRFRGNTITATSLYEQLERQECKALPHLQSFGTVGMGGIQADYELVVYPDEFSETLLQWLNTTTASEARALAILPSLIDLVGDMQARGIQPLNLSPETVLRHRDGRLVLNGFGALTESHLDVINYRPELAKTVLIDRIYAAPELAEKLVVSSNAAVFSFGQMLAACLWANPVAIADLRQGLVPYKAINDSKLARILLGCLWPDTKGRWQFEQLQSAINASIEDLPPVSAWESVMPGAASSAFTLSGQSYWRLEELLVEAVKPENWDAASMQFPAILDWAENSPWAGQVQLMQQAIADGHSNDWALIRLSRIVNPDTPATWRNLDLSDTNAKTNLINLAQRALNGDVQAEKDVRDFFEADLRGAFSATATQERP